MRQPNNIKFIFTEADYCSLLDFGGGDRIQSFSSVRNWFMRMAPKAILIGIIFSVIPALMLLIDPKDWTLYEKVLFCLIPFLFLMIFTLTVSFFMGVLLPRRVHKKYDAIIQAAFDGFTVKRMKAGLIQLVGRDEEWWLHFYQLNGRNRICMETLFLPWDSGKTFTSEQLAQAFADFCSRRYVALNGRALSKYVSFKPCRVTVTMPLSVRLLDADCIQLYDTIHNFIYSIGCHLVTHDVYKHA